MVSRPRPRFDPSLLSAMNVIMSAPSFYYLLSFVIAPLSKKITVVIENKITVKPIPKKLGLQF